MGFLIVIYKGRNIMMIYENQMFDSVTEVA